MKARTSVVEPTRGIPTYDLSESGRAFLAGIIEGEGSVGATKRKNYSCLNDYSIAPYVTIANCDLALITHLKQMVGVGSLKLHKFDARYRKQPLYIIDICRLGEVAWILRQVEPYLVSFKSKKARILLEFVDSRMKRPKKVITKRNENGKIECSTHPHYSDFELHVYERLMAAQPYSKGKHRRQTS